MDTLKNLKARLDTLCVFRKLQKDNVMESLCRYLENPTNSAYAAFVAVLYEVNGGDLSEHIKSICENSENIYVRTVGCGKKVPEHIKRALREELSTLQQVADLTASQLCAPIRYDDFLPDFTSSNINLIESYSHRIDNIGKYGYGIYAKNHMFNVDDQGTIVPVNNPDKIELSNLVDYEREQQIIICNTKSLLAGKPAANILLTGDAGTGKSSTVKAVGNALYAEGLRIIEIRKDQLRAIPKILNELAENPLKFILFIDDLSFVKDDDDFNVLKAVLEGSVSAKSKNVVIYATSNRRHLIKETFSDREGDDIHRNDTIQEFVSLSERFGIHISFSKPSKETFLHIVRHLSKENNIEMPTTELELLAERFALERGGRSARLARQFVDGLLSKVEEGYS